MSQASTYRVQDGCADCHHVFVRKEYDSDDELYSNFGAPERPPCMSVSMDESKPAPGQPWGVDDEGHRQWDAWKDGRQVVAQGICGEWLLKREGEAHDATIP